MSFSDLRAWLRRAAAIAFVFAAAGCGNDDPTGYGGTGRVEFTTSGGIFVEREIPPSDADEPGFSDGWSVAYTKFLVNFDDLQLLSPNDGYLGTAPRLLDLKIQGKKLIKAFDVVAKGYSDVNYAILPVTAESELAEGVAEEDKQSMLDAGYALWVEGVAGKADRIKLFSWGFALNTLYQRCHAEGAASDIGLAVPNDTSVEAELTIHGDRLFYDRLEPGSAVMTTLRFDAIAEADADDDGLVTLEELDASPLDLNRYAVEALEAATLGDFVRELARGLGHFNGNGECTVIAR